MCIEIVDISNHARGWNVFLISNISTPTGNMYKKYKGKASFTDWFLNFSKVET
jgi:hypothetical protein